jgi:hypothetical protein
VFYAMLSIEEAIAGEIPKGLNGQRRIGFFSIELHREE